MYNQDPVWVKKLALIFAVFAAVGCLVLGGSGVLGIGGRVGPPIGATTKEEIRAESRNYGAMWIVGGVFILVGVYYGWKSLDE